MFKGFLFDLIQSQLQKHKDRQPNGIETPQQFLSKYNQSHLELIKDKNYSIRKL